MRLVLVLFCLFMVLTPAESRDAAVWTVERGVGLARAGWELDEDVRFVPDENGIVTLRTRNRRRIRAAASFEADLGVVPTLQVTAYSTNGPWRLTAQAEDGIELLIGDSQAEGVFRTNLAEKLGKSGRTPVTLRIYMQKWDWESELRFSVSFEEPAPESSADYMSGEMASLDALMHRRAERIELLASRHTGGRYAHPRLRFNEDNREKWREFAAEHPEYAVPLADIIENIEQHKAEEPYVLTDEMHQKRRAAFGRNLLSVRPPEPPALSPGEGGRLFNMPGLQARHTFWTWRELYYHNFSHWHIGAAISDDPAFAEQAKRWAVTLSRWRFWLHPDYNYFDFTAGYPLQSFSSAYDIAYDIMSEEERADVRRAITGIAEGLYMNTLSGFGAIRNNIRGNHVAATMGGLGMAGMVLLGEDERAPLWIAMAEHLMLDSFEEHTSGGWTESPSYGNYGVKEWLQFIEMLSNVTGIDHFGHEFLRKYAEFQLHVSDWDGRDLGYHNGGQGEYWNQWVLYALARQFRDERFQWLGTYTTHAGFGNLFWWVDPDLPAERPGKMNTGRYFSDIGVSVWRTGWHDNATILLHKAGRRGPHRERDMNHITLYAFGERILPDGLGRGTTDHNVPLIDGKQQRSHRAAATLAYHSDEISGYALGDAAGVYDNARNSRRHVLFLRPDVVVLLDELPLGSEKKDVRFQLHPAGDVSVQDEILTARLGDVTLRAMTSLEDGNLLEMQLKEREPVRRETARRVRTTAEALFEGSGNLRAATFLLMTPEGEAPVPELSRWEGGLRVSWGEEEILLGMSPGEVAPGISTTGSLWLARLRGGEAKQVLVPGSDEIAVTDIPTNQQVRGWQWLRTGFLEIDHETQLRTPAGILRGSPSLSWEAE